MPSDLPAPLDVPTAIRRRRSVKFFEDRSIPAPILEEVLSLTAEAPSSYNLQPHRIVLVDDPEIRERIRAAGFYQPQFEHAPAVLVFCVDTDAWRDDYLPVIEQGESRGVWDASASQLMRDSIPQFQSYLKEHERLREYAIKDAMIAATHAILAATSLGLGSCFMNGWREDAVKEAIGAGNRPEIAVAVLLTLGYPAHAPLHPGRFPRDHTFKRNSIDG